MADVIRTAQYFKVQIADKPGTLAGILAPLREAGGNLLAVHAFPRSRRTQVDVVPEDPTAFKNKKEEEKGSGVFVGSPRARAGVLIVQIVSGILKTMGGATCASVE